MAKTDGTLESTEKLMPEAKTERSFECPTCGMKLKAATPTAACNGLKLGILVRLPKTKDEPAKALLYTDGSPVDDIDDDGKPIKKPWRVDGEVVKVNPDGFIFSHDGKKVLNKDDEWEVNPDRNDRGLIPGEHSGVEMEVAK